MPIHGGLKFEGTGLNVAFLMASIGFPMPGTQEAKGEKGLGVIFSIFVVVVFVYRFMIGE